MRSPSPFEARAGAATAPEQSNSGGSGSGRNIRRRTPRGGGGGDRGNTPPSFTDRQYYAGQCYDANNMCRDNNGYYDGHNIIKWLRTKLGSGLEKVIRRYNNFVDQTSIQLYNAKELIQDDLGIEIYDNFEILNYKLQFTPPDQEKSTFRHVLDNLIIHNTRYDFATTIANLKKELNELQLLLPTYENQYVLSKELKDDLRAGLQASAAYISKLESIQEFVSNYIETQQSNINNHVVITYPIVKDRPQDQSNYKQGTYVSTRGFKYTT